MKAAFMKIAHYEFRVCDNGNAIKNARTQFKEACNCTSATQEQIYLKDILAMTKDAFQESRLCEELKWSV